MKNQLHLLFTALMFYTRIPVPQILPYSDIDLNKSTRYFPLIGWMVGGLSFLGYYLLQYFFTTEISVIGALLIGILITGAFHEDGLADFFDGFGGGWTQERILDIMKDSRVGTYGMVATIFQLSIKFFALVELTKLFQHQLWILLLIFIVYHSLARASAIQLSFLLPYVREDETSKSKPIAKQFSVKEILGVVIFGLSPMILLLFNIPIYIFTLIPIIICIIYFYFYLNKWIGGYTGDCLGAVEQIVECIILLTFIALWKFI